MRKFGCNREYNTKDHWNFERIGGRFLPKHRAPENTDLLEAERG